MERGKVLELYYEAMNQVLESETPSLLYIRGLTAFCDKMLAEIEANLEEIKAAMVEEVIEPVKYGKGHALNEDDIQRMQNLKDNGYRQAEIARIIGCSPASVSRYLRGYTVKSTKEPGKGHIDWFRDLSVQGMGIKAISDRTGYAESIVKKYLGGEKVENGND